MYMTYMFPYQSFDLKNWQVKMRFVVILHFHKRIFNPREVYSTIIMFVHCIFVLSRMPQFQKFSTFPPSSMKVQLNT